ncbi:GAF domain-containing protein [Deinococcus roseus]|uniref:PAS domain-containing protein n=1 Tax=Deinococcus roseus TaxID=392414 RepID=A0ABQ2CZT0_9DEIO|nr:GAF domain-containing protein [Deinococcus roseus]GGJ36774.1 hypothetical protein GCM10008938_23550 [Deinococcus roseus]
MTQLLDPNEELRLENLYSYGILDTEDEVAFTRIAEDTAFLLQVPSVMVSFMDRERQWFKACIQFSKDDAVRKETFCQYTILSNEPMVVENATTHPMFREHPAVLGDPFIRAYLGVSIISPEGFRIGTLCAVDYQPRTFSDWDRKALQGMARRTIEELQQRLLHNEYQQVLQASPTGFVVLDAQQKIISANPAAQQITGLSWTPGERFEWQGLTVDPQASALKPVYQAANQQGWFTVQHIPLAGNRNLLVLEDTTDQIQYQLYFQTQHVAGEAD